MRLRIFTGLVISAAFVAAIFGCPSVALGVALAGAIVAAYGLWLHRDDPDDDRQ